MLARSDPLTDAAPPRERFSLRAFVVLLSTAVVVFAVDHLLKWLVVQHIPLHGQIPAQTVFVNIADERNTGAAFSLFPQLQFVFLVAAVLVSGYIIFAGQRFGHSAWVQITLGAVLGGSAANAVDRAAQGYVVDFVNFHWWPVFNFADVCIVVGILIAALTFGREQARDGHADASP